VLGCLRLKSFGLLHHYVATYAIAGSPSFVTHNKFNSINASVQSPLDMRSPSWPHRFSDDLTHLNGPTRNKGLYAITTMHFMHRYTYTQSCLVNRASGNHPERGWALRVACQPYGGLHPQEDQLALSPRRHRWLCAVRATATVGREALRTAIRRSRFGAHVISGSYFYVEPGIYGLHTWRASPFAFRKVRRARPVPKKVEHAQWADAVLSSSTIIPPPAAASSSTSMPTLSAAGFESSSASIASALPSPNKPSRHEWHAECVHGLRVACCLGTWSNWPAVPENCGWHVRQRQWFGEKRYVLMASIDKRLSYRGEDIGVSPYKTEKMLVLKEE
jgi:hypothetical protein